MQFFISQRSVRIAGILFALSTSLRSVHGEDVATILSIPDYGSDRLLETIRAFNDDLEPSARILGGEEASIENHPWQVAIVESRIKNNVRAQFCGGSLIGNDWVLTAAHCVDKGTKESQIQVLYGTHDLAKGGKRLKVASIHVHQDWGNGQRPKRDSDIALMKLDESTDFRPIKLLGEVPALAALSDRVAVTVSGWGQIEYRGPASPVLREVTVPIQPSGDCNAQDSYNNRVSDRMFCAGELEGGKDACLGDSGGPASVNIDGDTYQLGIVSWGDSCGKPKKYGVYTLIPRFIKWMKEKGALSAPKSVRE